MQFFYIMGILWIISLIFACEKFVVAGAVADWYFDRLMHLGLIICCVGRCL